MGIAGPARLDSRVRGHDGITVGYGPGYKKVASSRFRRLNSYENLNTG